MKGYTLPEGTELRDGRYRIEGVISQSATSVTYDAVHTLMGRRVVIKEFFAVGGPIDGVAVAPTDLRESFRKQASALARLDLPGVVSVLDVFDDNGTSYYVMDRIEGRTLQEVIDQDGPMDEGRALDLVYAVATSLQDVYEDAGMIHSDIAPDNVIIGTDGNIVLVGFDEYVAKAVAAANVTGQPVTIKRHMAYHPLEVYSSKQSAYTDIYSLGGLLYFMLCGKTPPTAMEVAMGNAVIDLPSNLPQHYAKAIAAALSTKPMDRGAFFEILAGEGVATAAENDMQANIAAEEPVAIEEEVSEEKEAPSAEREEATDSVPLVEEAAYIDEVKHEEGGEDVDSEYADEEYYEEENPEEERKRFSTKLIALTVVSALIVGLIAYLIIRSGSGSNVTVSAEQDTTVVKEEVDTATNKSAETVTPQAATTNVKQPVNQASKATTKTPAGRINDESSNPAESNSGGGYVDHDKKTIKAPQTNAVPPSSQSTSPKSGDNGSKKKINSERPQVPGLL